MAHRPRAGARWRKTVNTRVPDGKRRGATRSGTWWRVTHRTASTERRHDIVAGSTIHGASSVNEPIARSGGESGPGSNRDQSVDPAPLVEAFVLVLIGCESTDGAPPGPRRPTAILRPRPRRGRSSSRPL